MTSTSSHSGAGPPLTSAVPSTYTTQTLPVAVPLPDFWRQQPPSQRHLQHPPTQQHYAQQQQQPIYHYVNAPVSASPVMPSSSSSSHHASSSRSTHHQQQPPTTINANPQQQPLHLSQPIVYYAQTHSQPSSGVYHRGGPQSADSSSTSSLPVQYHYPVASTSTPSFPTATAQATKSDLKTAPASSNKNLAVEKENVRPASPKPTTKKPTSQRGRSATVETTQERSIEAGPGPGPGPGPDTPTAEDGDSSFDDAELTARFSSVSQIEAQPTLDPETGEAVYPCPFCDKHYGGKHARSIWRRHLSNKHGIPLNIQPRRTRWDNDLNRPKDEAERHKRTLESKRRWAAKNRAEKRAKRKGTTVEEELGLIEAAEAAEAAAAAAGRNHNSNNTTTNAGGSVYGDEDNAGGDESFTSQDGQSTSGPTQVLTQQQGQPLHQSQHQHHQGYWQNGPQIQQQLPAQPPQTSEHPYPTSLSSQFQYAHPQHAVEELQMEATPVQHVRYASHPPPQLQYAQQQQVTYLEGNAGHQPYTIVYPTYTLSPDPNTSARFQRSPSQPDFPTHVHQGAQYNAAVSPVDGSFQHQQGQYMQTVYQQVPVQHPIQGPSTATASLLQTTPLAQQPFLAPPSAASSNAPSLQRSLSAPIPTSGPIVYNRHNPPRLHQLPPAASQGISTSGAPVTYVQYHAQPAHYAMQTSDEQQQQQQQQQIAQAPDAAAAASIARPTSSTSGVTIYIPPEPPSTQTWGNDNAEQATPLAHPIPIYVQGQQQGQDQLQDGQSQMPPTPYFYLSVPPESTPIAEQQTPVVYAARPIPTSIQEAPTDVPSQASAREVLPVVDYAVPQAQVQQNVSDAAASEQALPVHRTVGDKTKSVQVSVIASTKSGKKKPSAGEHQNSTTAKKTQKQTVSANVAHSTKTYQEAAMQLLALKTASSSPPASPVKDYFASAAGGGNGADEDDNEDDDKDRRSMQEELDAEMWRSTDAEGSFAEVEDSGYAPYHDDHDDFMRHSKGAGSQQSNSTHKDGAHQSNDEEEEDDEDEQSTRQAHLRFASIPPSSPAPVRMSLSPESSPMPMSMPTVPSKLSATYLRAQQASSAAGNKRFTPIALQKKRKLTAGAAIGTENDENARHDVDGSTDVERDENDGDDDDDDEDGERISLDSSPVQEDEDMKAPLAKRRLISMSSASPRSRIRQGGGQHIITSTSGISDSRSPSPSRYTSAHSSSFATSVLMSTPHLGGDDIHGPRQQHSQAGNGSFFAGTGGEQRNDEGGNILSKRGFSHHHRSSIFKIDNCSRPSAGLSGMAGAASSSSPSRPFLLSSPEHAAVSKSLGLVPDNFTASNNNTSSFALPPSDSEVGFEMNSFLRGFNSIHSGDNGSGSKSWKRGQKQYGWNTDNGVGLSEYAKDVFGGPI